MSVEFLLTSLVVVLIRGTITSDVNRSARRSISPSGPSPTPSAGSARSAPPGRSGAVPAR